MKFCLIKSLFLILAIIITANLSICLGENNRIDVLFDDLELKYGIKVLYRANSDIFPREWTLKPINAQAIQINEKEILRFPALLRTALSKYPKKVITKNIEGIVLTKKIIFHGIEYGACNSSDFVYLCSDGRENGYTDDYLIDSFHHEFSSILFRNYKFPKEKWQSCNPVGFKYASVDDGGIKVIKEGKDSLEGSDLLYEQGFLSQYSISELEEDFNVYSGMILTNPRRFKSLIRKHDAINRKFNVWLSFHRSINRSFSKQALFENKTETIYKKK